MLTSEQIRERMGSSTFIFPGGTRVGGREIAQIREAGLTRMEVDGYLGPSHYDYYDQAQLRELASESKAQGVEIVSVHCPVLPWRNNEYASIREAVIGEMAVAIRAAEELGASIFVCHVGMNDAEKAMFREVARRTEDAAILLVLETGSIPDIMDFLQEFPPERVGLVVDIGHLRDEDGRNPVTVPGRSAETLPVGKSRLRHLHLHDFRDGRDHHPPFDGEVCWDEVIGTLEDMDYPGTFMFEPCVNQSTEDTLEKLRAFPEEFSRRYA
jgi:sugar phosphate isomerase/epimerase